jgi:hypothetical protein
VQQDLDAHLAKRQSEETHDAPVVLEIVARILQDPVAMMTRIQSLVLDECRPLELVTHAVLLAQHDQLRGRRRVRAREQLIDGAGKQLRAERRKTVGVDGKRIAVVLLEIAAGELLALAPLAERIAHGEQDQRDREIRQQVDDPGRREDVRHGEPLRCATSRHDSPPFGVSDAATQRHERERVVVACVRRMGLATRFDPVSSVERRQERVASDVRLDDSELDRRRRRQREAEDLRATDHADLRDRAGRPQRRGERVDDRRPVEYERGLPRDHDVVPAGQRLADRVPRSGDP